MNFLNLFARTNSREKLCFYLWVDIIKVVTSTNGSFWAPLSNLCMKEVSWKCVEQSKKPEESILHLMKALHHKHISAVKFISIAVIFSSGIELAFWICSFGGAGGKLNLKSSSNLSAAFHLPFSISKKYSYNRWHVIC